MVGEERYLGLNLVETTDGNSVYVKVSDFYKNGSLRLRGKYPQNFVDFDKYDLSPIKVLTDVNFKFILCLKESPISSDTTYYTSQQFINELQSSYQTDNEPYLVNATIKKEKIVVITLEEIKDRINEGHIKELNTLLSKNPTIVTRNLFEYPNYGPEPTYEINSTYDLDELVRYIDWVVSKPAQKYDERLLAANVIGEWISKNVEEDIIVNTNNDTTPASDEPSTNTNTNPNYPPIGRAGAYTGEIVQDNSFDSYVWTGYVWRPIDRDDGDGFNGGRL